MPTRLSWLPEELLILLTLKLDWWDIHEFYKLDEYRRFSNPNHPLWRELYQTSLSSYPVVSPLTYQDEYFRVWTKLDRPSYFNCKLNFIIKHGYHHVFKRISPLIESPRFICWHLSEIAEAGCLELIMELCQLLHPTNGRLALEEGEWLEKLHDALIAAVEHDRQPVIVYLHSLLPVVEYLDLLYAALRGGHYHLYEVYLPHVHHFNQSNCRRLMLMAAMGNHPKLVEWALSLSTKGTLCTSGLLGAIQGGHLELMDRFYSMGAQIDDMCYRSAVSSPNPKVYPWLFERSDVSPIDYLWHPNEETQMQILEYSLNRWPDQFTSNVWECLIYPLVSNRRVLTLLHHPQANFPPQTLKYLLYRWAADLNHKTHRHLFWALYYDEKRESSVGGWSTPDAIIDVLSVLPSRRLSEPIIRLGGRTESPVVPLDEFFHPVTAYKTILDSVEWSQEQVVTLLRNAIGRNSTDHLDAILAKVDVDHHPAVEAMLKEVETLSTSPHISSLEGKCHLDLSAHGGPIAPDVAYIRSLIT